MIDLIGIVLYTFQMSESEKTVNYSCWSDVQLVANWCKLAVMGTRGQIGEALGESCELRALLIVRRLYDSFKVRHPVDPNLYIIQEASEEACPLSLSTLESSSRMNCVTFKLNNINATVTLSVTFPRLNRSTDVDTIRMECEIKTIFRFRSINN